MDLHIKLGDEWLNDLMICYIEKEIFMSIDNEKTIIKQFEEIKKNIVYVSALKTIYWYILYPIVMLRIILKN